MPYPHPPDEVLPEGGGDFPVDLPELLLRPVAGGDPLRAVLAGEVAARLERAAAVGVKKGEDAPEVAAGRLRKLPPPWGGKRWAVLWMAALAVLLAAVGLGMVCYEVIPIFGGQKGAPEWVRQQAARQMYGALPKDLPPAGGDGWGELAEAGALRAWRLHPEDPACYARYARIYMRRGELPPDYEETWRRIDPDNGFWLLLEVDCEMRQTHHGVSPISAAKASEGPSVGQQEKAKKALEEAGRKLRLESYVEAGRRDVARRRDPVPSNSGQVLGLFEVRGWSWRRAGVEGDWKGMEEALFYVQDFSGEDGFLPPHQQRVVDWVAHEQNEGGSGGLATVAWKLRCCVALVACWRLGLLLGALVFLGAAGALALRRLPRGNLTGRMENCAGQVLRPWACVPAMLQGAVVTLAGMGLWWWAAVGELNYSPLETVRITGQGVALMLAVTVWQARREAGRREAGRRLAFLGIGDDGGGRRKAGAATWLVMAGSLAAWAVVAGVLVYLKWMEDRRPVPPADEWVEMMQGPVAWVSGAVVLWLGVELLLGYARPGKNLRHRLVAMQLIPALLAAAVLFAGLAVFSQPVEKEMVRRAWVKLE